MSWKEKRVTSRVLESEGSDVPREIYCKMMLVGDNGDGYDDSRGSDNGSGDADADVDVGRGSNNRGDGDDSVVVIMVVVIMAGNAVLMLVR